MNEQQIRNRTLQHSQIEGLRLEVARLKREVANANRRAGMIATRAVYAFIQDNIVGVDMVDDLDVRVERAKVFAFKTKTVNDAIDMAAKYAAAERDQQARAIRDCEKCRKRYRETSINYPGTNPHTEGERRCEAHR